MKKTNSPWWITLIGIAFAIAGIALALLYPNYLRIQLGLPYSKALNLVSVVIMFSFLLGAVSIMTIQAIDKRTREKGRKDTGE
jgi:membrane-bound ClpP family serine protease